MLVAIWSFCFFVLHSLPYSVAWPLQLTITLKKEDSDPDKNQYNEYFYAGGLIEYVSWLNTDKVCLTFNHLHYSCSVPIVVLFHFYLGFTLVEIWYEPLYTHTHTHVSYVVSSLFIAACVYLFIWLVLHGGFQMSKTDVLEYRQFQIYVDTTKFQFLYLASFNYDLCYGAFTWRFHIHNVILIYQWI